MWRTGATLAALIAHPTYNHEKFVIRPAIVRQGTALLVATHDPRMRRIVRMHDGVLEEAPAAPAPVLAAGAGFARKF